MENNYDLYIEKLRNIAEPKPSKHKFQHLFWDINEYVFARVIQIADEKLEVGQLYEFNFHDLNDDDEDIYHYLVIKDLGIGQYLIAEYYDQFIKNKEGAVSDEWVKEDVQKRYDISFEQIHQDIQDRKGSAR